MHNPLLKGLFLYTKYMEKKENIEKLEKTVNSLINGQKQTSELINSLNKTIKLQNQNSQQLIETIGEYMREQKKFNYRERIFNLIAIITAFLAIPILLTITSYFS